MVRNDIEVLTQGKVLEHRRHTHFQRFAWRVEHHLFAKVFKPPGPWLMDSGSDPDQRGFPRTDVTHEGHNFTGAH